MKPLFIFLVIFTTFEASASGDNIPLGARAGGMSNAAVTLNDMWAVSHNQAGLATLENVAAGFHFQNQFLLNELNVGAAAVAIPVNAGVIGASIIHFGYNLYSETKVGLAYARTFGSRFSAGLQLNYHYLFMGDVYGPKTAVTVEAGVIFSILPQLKLGVHIFNPSRAKIADYADERIPSVFKTGFSYTFSDKVILAVEAEKSLLFDVQIKAGVEYRVVKSVFVRAGVGTHPATNSFGFGISRGRLNIDFATSYHYILGYSPQVGITYHLR